MLPPTVPAAPPLRRHQREALASLDALAAGGSTRSWVVLPPGAGKTRVGLERARAEEGRRAVVLAPNTAIQGQWVDQARAAGIEAGTDRGLGAALTALTYQSLAVFDPDAAEPVQDRDEGDATDGGGLLGTLHPRGRALVEELRSAGPILLVLDECHHLLEVWGQLLDEVLGQLPEAHVLGLTATPPEALTAEQRDLVDRLFGAVAYATSIPAVVREGDLAPFVELAWVTSPTPAEREWLGAEAERFAGLVSALLDPGFGSTPFLSWVDARFVVAGEDGVDGTGPAGVTWAQLVRREPALCAAALRLHHAGLMARPVGARPGEEHRRGPSADDWVLLVDDWVTRCVARSEDPADEAVVRALRRALPSVGYQWTRRGIRGGRTPIDRVLARSLAKTTAAVEIAAEEGRGLGEGARVLVLCDHERATATLPADLEGVLDQQAGSASAVLDALVAAPDAAVLAPLLVTGRTVAAAPATLHALVAHVAVTEPDLAARLEVLGDGAVATVGGPWRSRVWVRHVTTFFESGGTRLLVGTRGLLGEGWDARRITSLVDLTISTTTTSVVQTRGRALRTDPAWPGKVATSWSVVCVDHDHPTGEADWRRLVRKHDGFFALDTAGDVVDGVAHLDPHLSPYAPPAADAVGALNARMLVRAQDRDAVREAWRVGEAYDGAVAHTVRLLPRRPGTLAPAAEAMAAPVVVREQGLDLRDVPAPVVGRLDGPAPPLLGGAVLALVGALVGQVSAATSWVAPVLLVLGVLLAVGAAATVRLPARRAELAHGREVLVAAARPPSLAQVAAAVADGLLDAGLVARGAAGVEVVVDAGGEYRCRLTGVPEAESAVFAVALDEAVGPLVAPRYVVPRGVVTPPAAASAHPARAGRRHEDAAADERARQAARGLVAAEGTVWHAVPTVLGANAGRARGYAAAWDRWVGGGDPLFTGSPEGAGVLASQQGADPFDVTTVMRRTWR